MADTRIDKPTIRRLLDTAEPEPLLPARTSPVQVQLSRFSESRRALVEAIPQPVRTISRHSIWFCYRASLIGAAAVTLVLLAFYGRLATGPISFKFLVPTLQDQLNSQVKGYRFTVGDAILRLSGTIGLEFRLANVRVADATGREIAKAPLAAINLSKRSLIGLSVAPSAIELIEPKVLIVDSESTGKAAVPPSATTGSAWQPQVSAGRPVPAAIPAEDTQVLQAAPALNVDALNPAATFASLFSALESRGRSSQALKRIGVRDAKVFLSRGSGVSTVTIPSFHFDLEEGAGSSALLGEINLIQDQKPWRILFKVTNRPQQRRYAITASVHDIVPRELWKSYPLVDELKLMDLPVSASVNLEYSHSGILQGGDGEVKLGQGRFFAPWDMKHPAEIDSGIIRASYDKKSDAVKIAPVELKWQDSVLSIGGTIARRNGQPDGKADWAIDLDGSTTRLGAPQFGLPAVPLDTLRLNAVYSGVEDRVVLNGFKVRAADAEIAIAGEAANVSGDGTIRLKGSVSPMPVAFLKLIWPTFVANGARDWIGTNVPTGRITGGALDVNLTKAMLEGLDNGGDIPDDAVSLVLRLSGLTINHVKGAPPIKTKDSTARVIGRKFIVSIPTDARIDVPSGKNVAFSDGQLVIPDLRPEFPDAEIQFKAQAEVASAMELLDGPPFGYVSQVGFKPNLVNGQASTTIKLTLPLLKEPKFEQMKLAGKARVTDLKSNALPGGHTVTGGSVVFDLSETAIGANGDVRVNGIPVTVAWQRVFALPPEKQPVLKAAAILTDKGREELQLNINHIVKGDLPIALGLALQKDGPPRIFMEANLTQADVFLSAIGWRKTAGQKALLTFDVAHRPDNSIFLDNFKMSGDGLNVEGELTLNDKKRIASFNFPEFSTNQLTHVAVKGDLVPGNILKVHAKGQSFDARQFFLNLLSSGKASDNAPVQKDEPGLDLAVEVDTVFGFYDTTLKSLTLSAKRRQGKLTYLDVSGRLNGEQPLGIRVDTKGGQRTLIADCIDGGSAFRLIGLYSAMRGGLMSMKVNLDGDGQADKSGVLYVNNFVVAGDQVAARVVSRAEQERASKQSGPRGTTVPNIAAAEGMQFDRLRVPFALANGQFILRDFAINGPALGATMRGKVDFAKETLSLSGTYVPLYGLNSMLGAVPLFGELLKGRDGEGVVGITFAVQGRTANPDVVVNPLSAMAPGFLRQLFEFDNNRGAAEDDAAPPKPKPAPPTQQKRASRNSAEAQN
jgi:hypothetical protein